MLYVFEKKNGVLTPVETSNARFVVTVAESEVKSALKRCRVMLVTTHSWVATKVYDFRSRRTVVARVLLNKKVLELGAS